MDVIYLLKRIKFGKPPKEVRKNIEKLREIKKEAKKVMVEKFDTERFIVLVFPSREKKNEFLKTLGLPEDERYIIAEDVEIKPKKIEAGGIKTGPASRTGATG